MHELAVTREIVEILRRRSEGRRILRVVVEVGRLSCVAPEAMRFCFDLCAEGTPAAGARLEIVRTPGRGNCRTCGADVPLESPLGRCDCGSTDLEWRSGEELRVVEMDVEDEALGNRH